MVLRNKVQPPAESPFIDLAQLVIDTIDAASPAFESGYSAGMNAWQQALQRDEANGTDPKHNTAARLFLAQEAAYRAAAAAMRELPEVRNQIRQYLDLAHRKADWSRTRYATYFAAALASSFAKDADGDEHVLIATVIGAAISAVFDAIESAPMPDATC